MKKLFIIIATIIFIHNIPTYAANSMFDDNGNYSGNWKQMTNVSSSSSQNYSSSSYSTSSWYNSQKQARQQTLYNTQTDVVPFRYNTLNYTRIRKVKGGYGDYNSKCTDIGDASFCQ